MGQSFGVEQKNKPFGFKSLKNSSSSAVSVAIAYSLSASGRLPRKGIKATAPYGPLWDIGHSSVRYKCTVCPLATGHSSVLYGGSSSAKTRYLDSLRGKPP